MVYLIGLTGGIASGKTTAAHFFSRLGARIIDCDMLARDVMQDKSLQAALKERYGDWIYLPDGGLNRSALREHIFTHLEEKKWLEAWMHPRIREAFFKACELPTDSPYTIGVIPLLVERHWQPYLDRICVIDVDPQQQLERACLRDHMSNELATLIMSQQCDRSTRLSYADDVITNTADLATLEKTISSLHDRYCSLAKGVNY